jgi:hypothetical protein
MLLSRFMLVAMLHTHKTRQSALRISIAGQAYVSRTLRAGIMEKNIDINEQIKKFKDAIFYIDWNIYSYLSDLSATSTKYENKAKCFSIILDNYFDKEKRCLVFSNSHYRDILLGSEEYYQSKIEYLYQRTNGWKVSEYKQNRELIYIEKCDDIYNDFAQYKKNVKFSNKPLDLNQNTLELLSKEIDNNPKLEQLRKRIFGIINDRNNCGGLSVLLMNKVLRNSDIVTKEGKIKYPKINENILTGDNDIREIVNKALNESSIDYSLIDSFLNSISKICSLFMSNFTLEIMRLSYLCDFVGLTSEKLSKKTSFEGMIDDVMHISLALRLPVFISEDQNLLVKAKFIKKWMKLSVNIFDMDTFITEILKIVYKNDENKDTKIVIKMKENDNIIGTFEI